MVSLVVISVESLLSNHKGSTNRDVITSILGCSGKKGVDVVHGRYDHTDTWCGLREKCSCMF